MKLLNFLYFSLLYCLVSGVLHRKQLAGPPEEFHLHDLPHPNAGSLVERSALIEMNLARENNTNLISWTTTLPVDSETLFAFTIFSPEENYVVHLTDPDGIVVKANPVKGDYPVGYQRIPSTSYVFDKNIKRGLWKLRIELARELLYETEIIPKGAVLLFNEANTRIHTSLNTYELKFGKEIGLLARLTDETNHITTRAPKALREVVYSAVMDITMPDGTTKQVKMHDDGLHADLYAHDGVYGGFIDGDEVGVYKATAVLKGKNEEGIDILRTSQHVIPVIPHQLELSDSAWALKKDDNRLLIAVEVNLVDKMASINSLFKAFAQVWGKNINGDDIAVCWVGGIVEVQDLDPKKVIILELDLNWVRRAEAHGPFVLKNLYIQDAHFHVPLSQKTEIPVKATKEVSLMVHKLNRSRHIQITKEMRVGVFPAELRKVNKTARTEKTPNLLLTHGYCPGEDNPWDKFPDDWDNPAFFLIPFSNMPNEVFAQKLAAFAEENQMESFGVIAHSQGGLASLHMLNYYFTPLDNAKGERKIQTVGSPWLGNTGAGSTANLATIFGIGCGPNFDLTTDGATLWLSGITAEHRKEVYFYTTTYKQASSWGDWCNLAVNMVLKWPNDGTAEEDHAYLPGGNDMGNVEGWCHSIDMAYPPQYWDRERNVLMNELAAR